jgi:hypothetical protein
MAIAGPWVVGEEGGGGGVGDRNGGSVSHCLLLFYALLGFVIY